MSREFRAKPTRPPRRIRLRQKPSSPRIRNQHTPLILRPTKPLHARVEPAQTRSRREQADGEVAPLAIQARHKHTEGFVPPPPAGGGDALPPAFRSDSPTTSPASPCRPATAPEPRHCAGTSAGRNGGLS